MKSIRGKVQGRTIVLDEDLGVPEGQEVEITVRFVPSTQQWGEGLRRCAGALADEWAEEDEQFLDGLDEER